MTTPSHRDAIFTAALRLPEADRERLAGQLADSLDNPSLTEVDRAWVAEAERRVDELLSCAVLGIPDEQAFDEIERELGWRD